MNVLKLWKWMNYIHSYLKKKRLFLIILLERITREIVGYAISFDRNPETIQKIIDSSPKAKQYYSDGYPGYFKLNYHGGKYESLNNKSQTHNIESVNSDFRKYIPFLQRKSKCFPRSLETFEAVFKVFTYIYNKLSEFKRKFSNLKNIYLINFI